MPNLPGPKVAIPVVPDRACEILSKGTRSYDLVKKRRFYAEVGVAWLWYLDPREQTLTVSQLVEGKWLELGLYGGDDKA